MSDRLQKSLNGIDHRGMYIKEDALYEAGAIGCVRTRGPFAMTDKTYLVRFKSPDIGNQVVVAERTQVYGEHLAFLNSKGELAALFLLETVEDWSELSE